MGKLLFIITNMAVDGFYGASVQLRLLCVFLGEKSLNSTDEEEILENSSTL